MKSATIKPIALILLCLGIFYLVSEIQKDKSIKAKEISISSRLKSCDQAFRLNVDQMTNDSSYMMVDSILFYVPSLVDSGYLTLYKNPSGFSLLMFFLGKGVPIDSEEKIYFLFEDSTRCQCWNDTDLNFNGMASVSSLEKEELTPEMIGLLNKPTDAIKEYSDFPNEYLFKNKRLKAVRIHGVNKTYDFEIPSDYRDVLKYAFNCLQEIN